LSSCHFSLSRPSVFRCFSCVYMYIIYMCVCSKVYILLYVYNTQRPPDCLRLLIFFTDPAMTRFIYTIYLYKVRRVYNNIIMLYYKWVHKHVFKSSPPIFVGLLLFSFLVYPLHRIYIWTESEFSVTRRSHVGL